MDKNNTKKEVIEIVNLLELPKDKKDSFKKELEEKGLTDSLLDKLISIYEGRLERTESKLSIVEKKQKEVDKEREKLESKFFDLIKKTAYSDKKEDEKVKKYLEVEKALDEEEKKFNKELNDITEKVKNKFEDFGKNSEKMVLEKTRKTLK